MNHRQSIREHFIKRFKERIGVELTTEEYNALSARCSDRRFAKFCGWTSDRNQLLKIDYKNFTMKVAYSPIFNKLVTIFPDSVINK